MAGRLYTLLGKVAGGVRLRTRLGRVVVGGRSGTSSMASGDTSVFPTTIGLTIVRVRSEVRSPRWSSGIS